MSVCLCVCFKLSRADLSHQGANHHDHSGGIMILGGPGVLAVALVLRRARSMILQAPPGRRRGSVSLRHAMPSHGTGRDATSRDAARRHAVRRHATPRHGHACHDTTRHAVLRDTSPSHATNNTLAGHNHRSACVPRSARSEE